MRNTFNSYISEEIHTKFIEQFEFGKKLFYEIEKLDFVKDLKKFELKYFLKSEKSIIDSIKRRSWNLLKQYNEFDEFEFKAENKNDNKKVYRKSPFKKDNIFVVRFNLFK